MKIIETIEGDVVRGKGIGKSMGFPTLNVLYEGNEEGIFAGLVYCDGKEYKAAINIGGSPTLGDGGKVTDGEIVNVESKICETFLLDVPPDFSFSGELKIELLKKIRDTKKFKDKSDLKKQIARDVDFVKITLC